jgi:hypothetical protein
MLHKGICPFYGRFDKIVSQILLRASAHFHSSIAEVCFVPQHIFTQQSIAEDLLRIQSFCR